MTADDHFADLDAWIRDRFSVFRDEKNPDFDPKLTATGGTEAYPCLELVSGFWPKAEDAAKALSVTMRWHLHSLSGALYWRHAPSVGAWPYWQYDFVNDPSGPLTKREMHMARCRFFVVPR